MSHVLHISQTSVSMHLVFNILTFLKHQWCSLLHFHAKLNISTSSIVMHAAIHPTCSTHTVNSANKQSLVLNDTTWAPMDRFWNFHFSQTLQSGAQMWWSREGFRNHWKHQGNNNIYKTSWWCWPEIDWFKMFWTKNTWGQMGRGHIPKTLQRICPKTPWMEVGIKVLRTTKKAVASREPGKPSNFGSPWNQGNRGNPVRNQGAKGTMTTSGTEGANGTWRTSNAIQDSNKTCRTYRTTVPGTIQWFQVNSLTFMKSIEFIEFPSSCIAHFQTIILRAPYI